MVRHDRYSPDLVDSLIPQTLSLSCLRRASAMATIFCLTRSQTLPNSTRQGDFKIYQRAAASRLMPSWYIDTPQFRPGMGSMSDANVPQPWSIMGAQMESLSEKTLAAQKRAFLELRQMVGFHASTCLVKLNGRSSMSARMCSTTRI